MGMSKPMVFDGIDDNVTVAHDSVFNVRSITISAWVIINKLNAENVVVAKEYGSTWEFGTGDSGRVHLNANINGVYDSHMHNNGIALVAGELNHIVWTYDKDSNSSKTYLNGALQHTVTPDAGDGSGLGINSSDIDMGSRSGSSVFAKGSINEVSIFSSALSLTEIYAIFNDGVALDVSSDSGDYASSDDLIGYWRNTGTGTWTDLSDEGNDGTPSGSPDTILLPEGTTSGKDILGFPLTHTNNGWLNFDANQVNDSEETTPYVLCPVPSGSPLDLTQLFTVEAWVKIDKEGNTNYIVGNWVGADRGWHLAMSQHSPAKLSFTWTTDGQWATQVSKSTASGISNLVGNWRHIVCIYNMGVVSFYVDTVAQSVTTPDEFDGQTIWSARNLTIGRGYAYWEGIKGNLDEVKVYNRALSATEITKNYKHGLGKHS